MAMKSRADDGSVTRSGSPAPASCTGSHGSAATSGLGGASDRVPLFTASSHPGRGIATPRTDTVRGSAGSEEDPIVMCVSIESKLLHAAAAWVVLFLVLGVSARGQ